MQSDAPVTSTAVSTAVDIRRFPWMRRLATDYAYAFDQLAPFYAGNPAEPRAWAEAIGRTRALRRTPGEIARIIATQQERRGAPPAARAAAARLADPDAVVVITGQQAGLFGGPLYTLHKAITTLKLAERVSREHGVTAIPVFWADAEDHDWAEVRGCTVLDEELQPCHLQLTDPPGAGTEPIARLTLSDDVDRALELLAASLPHTDFTPQLLAELHEAYRPGRSMAEAFARWIELVLGPRGLVVYESADPATKPLVAELFARELASPGESARLATEAGERLRARGYHAQVEPAAGATALFSLEQGRESIRIDGDRATVGARESTAAALVDEARRHPERFSPNVLLRPLVQDTIFPTLAYVAGPSELAYQGQLRDVYAHFGIPQPLIVPRASATLVDSATLRFLAKYDVSLELLQARDEAGLNQLLQSQLPPSVELAITAAERAIDEQMEAVAGVVPLIDPTLEGTARSTLTRMQNDLRTLHNKVIQAAKRRDDTLRRQFQHAQALAFPEGEPQERAIGLVWLLNRFGPAAIARLLEDLPLDAGQHAVLTL